MPASNKIDQEGKVSVFSIKVPLALAFGLYEQLTITEIEEHLNDLRAELQRRV
jgi:hypothetical protein